MQESSVSGWLMSRFSRECVSYQVHV
uniref:Uncharacterized protein n=1 Tax=Anguilla anguilla TaxID=7936 RepID=A0A0E9XLM1_ANGAN